MFHDFFSTKQTLMSESDFSSWLGHHIRRLGLDIAEYAELVGEEPHFIRRVCNREEEPSQAILDDLRVREVMLEEIVPVTDFKTVKNKYYEEIPK